MVSCQGLGNSLPLDLRYFLALLSTFFLFLVMGKDRLVLDVTSGDRRRALKYFVANFHDFCTMEDFFNLVDRQKINYLSSSYLQLQHYLGEEPTIQGTLNFLRQLKQDPGMSIQDWHTLVCLEYQECNFPSAVDNHLITRLFFHRAKRHFHAYAFFAVTSPREKTLVHSPYLNLFYLPLANSI